MGLPKKLLTCVVPRRLQDPLEILVLNEELASLAMGEGCDDVDSLFSESLFQVIHGDMHAPSGFSAPIILASRLRDANGIDLTGRSPGQLAKMREMDEEEEASYCLSTILEAEYAAPHHRLT